MTTASLEEVLRDGRGVERSFRCHMHDDTTASASVNTTKGVWYCYACHASGVVDGVDLVPEAEDLIKILKGDVPAEPYAESWLDLFDAFETSPYWSERFTPEVAAEYRCGTHPLTGQPTYPIRNVAGNPVGVVVRGDGKPKYKYPYGVSTSRTFFGHIRPNPVVVLVEGAADVMAIATGGIPKNWTVLGCYGAGVHAPQVQIIGDLAPYVVILAFDDDDAGRLAMQRSEASLAHVAPCVSHPWGSMGANDPGDLPVGQAITGLRKSLSTTTYKKFA